MFKRLGDLIARRPALCVAAWGVVLAAAIAWTVWAPKAPQSEVGSFLPPGSPNNISSDILKEAFPDVWSNSMIVLAAHRPTGITPSDLLWLDEATRATRDDAAKIVEAETPPGQTPARVSCLSPTLPFVRERLLSRDGQAALALVNLPTTFISEGTIAAVQAVNRNISHNRPAGLRIEVTGPAGIGHDYFVATQVAAHRTTWVTVVAVLLILMLVYRSPIGALVPLVSIGASVFVAFVVLDLLVRVGWEVTAMDRIFIVVLMFGAGVDYALFWIARYREGLAELETPDRPEDLCVARSEAARPNPFEFAARLATRETGPAILASAGTTICGLTTMLAANLVPSRNAGKVLAVAILVALLASLTLAPAIARCLGPYLFWPTDGQIRSGSKRRSIWPWLAQIISRRPRPVLGLGTLVLTILALASLHFPPRFDALQELPPDTSSARGLKLAEAHFDKGQIYSNSVLAVYEPGKAPNDLSSVSRAIRQTISRQAGVTNVFSLDQPLGKSSASSKMPSALLSLMTQSLYEGHTRSDQTVLRFEILAEYMPFSPEAIGAFDAISAAVKSNVASGHEKVTPQIMLSGLTSYVINVKAVVGADQRRVMSLATLVISVIVFLMVRDPPLTFFMVLTTWLTYGATITLSNLFLIHVVGLAGLDWKVRLILFVIVVAVGQDYNIFLVSRLLRRSSFGTHPITTLLTEPGSQKPVAPVGDGASTRQNATGVTDAGSEVDPRIDEVREAIIRTGSVISSCGIIMAATLGSLWAGGLSLLRQLGFALALGILIDTFFVRPLLIPSFYLVWGKRGRLDRPSPQTADSENQQAPDLGLIALETTPSGSKRTRSS